MKALVTGASGFIGSTLIEELDTLGFEVVALMRKESRTRNLEGLKYQSVVGDLSDFDSLRSAVRGVDYVFHLAGVTKACHRRQFFECNARGTDRIARALVTNKNRLTRFVLVSSLAAAGPALTLRPRVETEQDCPVSAYGESKLKERRNYSNIKTIFQFQLFDLLWYMVHSDRTLFVMIQTIARNLMPILQGSSQGGHKYYSAIHARDLCRGIVTGSSYITD